MHQAEILQKLAQNQAELKTRFAVSSLSLFGSTARGTTTADSDLDILVEFYETPGLFKFLELKAHLENLFQRPVDLVTKKALKKPLRKRILQETLHAI